MQAAISTLPKLYALRGNGPSAPVFWSGDVATDEAQALGSEKPHDVFSRGDGATLRGDACTDTALVGSLVEVGIALLRRKSLDSPLDVDLTLQLMPEEGQGDMPIEGDLLPLATLIIAVEDEPIVQELLEQDGTHARPSVGRSRGYDDGGGFVHFHLDRLLKPLGDDAEGLFG